MRQAIKTKYLGPTDTRNTRIKASCDAGSVVVFYDHSLNPTDNHKAAINELVRRLEWTYGQWHYGWIGDSMVAVCDD